MHNIKHKLMHAAIILAFLPVMANAASLGKLTINSNVGEPLNAEIELVAVAKDELSSITANIATDEAYALQGMQRSAALKDIRLEINKKLDGKAVLLILSKQPVSISSLDMLIVLNTLGGRALNEYTLYLPKNTPNTAQQTSPINMPVVTAQTSTPPAPIYRDPDGLSVNSDSNLQQSHNLDSSRLIDNAILSPNYIANINGSIESSNSETKKSFTVKPGDSLNKIAKKIPLEEFSFQQLLVGLFKNNKSAFDGNNMNRLRTGKVINTPNTSVIKAIPQREAVNIITAQVQEYGTWKSGETSDLPVNASTGKVENQTPVLKLSGKKIVDDKSELDDISASHKYDSALAKAMALQEELTAKINELTEANSRIAALEEQLASMKALLNLKSNVAEQSVGAPAVASDVALMPSINIEKNNVATPNPSPVPIPAAIAHEEKPLDKIITQAKEYPLYAGGALGGLGLLLAVGFMRRKKSKTDITGTMDPEIESEMSGLQDVTINTSLDSSNEDYLK